MGEKTLGAHQLGCSKKRLRATGGHLGLASSDFGRERPRVDGEQQVAFAHLLSFAEVNLLQRPGHPGAHIDRVGRLEPCSDLLEVLHIAL